MVGFGRWLGRKLLLAGFGASVCWGLTGSASAVQVGAPFELVDQDGSTRRDADFRGSYMLIYFGFTHCPDICPTALSTMTEALDTVARADAAGAARVVPMLISIDPERDTPEVLRGYVELFDARLVAFTGTRDAIRDVGRAYGVFAARIPGGAGGYGLDHTSFVYLMGPDGRYIEHFQSDVGVADLARALRKALADEAVGRS